MDVLISPQDLNSPSYLDIKWLQWSEIQRRVEDFARDNEMHPRIYKLRVVDVRRRRVAR